MRSNQKFPTFFPPWVSAMIHRLKGPAGDLEGQHGHRTLRRRRGILARILRRKRGQNGGKLSGTILDVIIILGML